ncbi:TIGR03088 family PEP-CTERM/XrtA system glycosyltransferase [Pseudoduganella aquatica]|uniref:TIGR03088 family PEP-CTERM/XrtA system glycosyltransferase n=1 Tax=Pseudoduganella aquatica TaxID=2660641 RepID=UPI001E3178B1|nr:TIGR03088 family PEP-CTERM/XrtA system glycosyltransferase [Pseudoduganella aquatica]
MSAPLSPPPGAQADTRPLVLHVIHHLVMGGLENGLVNLINTMPPERYRHAIVCVENYNDFRLRIARADVEVIALHRSRIGIWRMRLEMLRLFRRLRPAIVHSRNMSGLDALLPARLAGVRTCVHGEHGWDVGDLDGSQWKPALLRRLHAPLVDRYITVSQDLARYLARRVGVAQPRIRQVYNGVDTARFAPRTPGAPRPALPDGFAGPDDILIGTVGRLQPVKDQATLLRAFARLRETQPALWPRLRLAIVGGGPLEAELQALVAELDVGAQVWLSGARDDVPAILASFDVFVLPSLSEGISNTILEAMACGLPVLATGVGGNLELVKDGVCGRFFPPGDVDALSGLLAAYGGDAGLRGAHGAAARHIAVEEFSMAAMVNNYMAVYDSAGKRA